MDKNKDMMTKAQAAGILRSRLPQYAERLSAIDERLVTYLNDLHEHTDLHNMWEILGGVRFLRIFATYPFKAGKVKKILRLYEGEWKDGRHVRGGLLFSGLRGRSHYQLTPIQVFMFAGVYGPHHWVNTEAKVGTRDLLRRLYRKHRQPLMDRRHK